MPQVATLLRSGQELQPLFRKLVTEFEAAEVSYAFARTAIHLWTNPKTSRAETGSSATPLWFEIVPDSGTNGSNFHKCGVHSPH